MAEELRKCVEHGKKIGVLIGIQNHGDMLKRPTESSKIVEMVDSSGSARSSIRDTSYTPTPTRISLR